MPPSTPSPADSRPTGDLSLSRRSFLRSAAALGLASQLPRSVSGQFAESPTAFKSEWGRIPDRVWAGPEYWANPLQDWRVDDGRLECVGIGSDRNVHLLTHDLLTTPGDFVMSVRVGRLSDGPLGETPGSAGFRIGVNGPLREYRNNAVFGTGLDVGLAAGGRLFIGRAATAANPCLPADTTEVTLRLKGITRGGICTLRLEAMADDGREVGAISQDVPAADLAGNLAVVCNYGRGAPSGRRFETRPPAGAKDDAFWFADWRLAGSSVGVHPERAFGPILFSHYTLDAQVLKMTAQLPPLGEKDNDNIELEVSAGGAWRSVGKATIHPESRTASFRVENWDATRDHAYHLVYRNQFTDGTKRTDEWRGVVRHNPVAQAEIVVGDVSCNFHSAFPNAELVGHMAKLDPDLLAFVGDQFYEASGGFGVERAPLDRSIVDYLRKWFLHGWTWRELMKDRPSLSLPDDHDVYQGNLWGEGGGKALGSIEAGGYGMPAAWVNVVHRTQTSHHPDPHDPQPGKQGISNWYGAFNYGGIDFAVLADRQYKSGPEGKVPPTGNPRSDHVVDPDFDPRTVDIAGLDLLGDEQEAFLDTWSRNWEGAAMKVVVSQTIFSAMATTHGPQREILRADYDANGWPQTPRQRAVRSMRRACAFHVAGDQHLPALVQYGIDRHGDGPVGFAGPAVNVGYPRWWEPATAPWTQPCDAELTGDFTDSFGLPFSVLAVANGRPDPRKADVMQFMTDKASGLGIVRFNKERMTAKVECWPFRADPAVRGTQFPGWPVTIDLVTHHRRGATGFLPALKISGVRRPVVEVIEESSGDLIYAIRLTENEFTPHVFAPGTYALRVLDTASGKSKLFPGLSPESRNSGPLNVVL